MLSGMSIQLTQQYEEGDEVILETGEQGIISNIGPLHTYLRGKHGTSNLISRNKFLQSNADNERNLATNS